MFADWLLLALAYLWAVFLVSLGVYALTMKDHSSRLVAIRFENFSINEPSRSARAVNPTEALCAEWRNLSSGPTTIARRLCFTSAGSR